MILRERRLNRLKNYDYSKNGYYFVTICIKNREHFFGEIQNGKMILNKYGEIVGNQWLWLPWQYPYLELDKFIIMPNHMHGIVIIDNNNYHIRRGMSRCYCRGRSRPVPAETTVSTTNTIKIKSLSQLIGAFKTTSSKIIHQNGLKIFNWQRSFHDHIIRDEQSLNNIRKYIKNNPMKWGLEKNTKT